MCRLGTTRTCAWVQEKAGIWRGEQGSVPWLIMVMHLGEAQPCARGQREQYCCSEDNKGIWGLVIPAWGGYRDTPEDDGNSELTTWTKHPASRCGVCSAHLEGVCNHLWRAAHLLRLSCCAHFQCPQNRSTRLATPQAMVWMGTFRISGAANVMMVWGVGPSRGDYVGGILPQEEG